jgi:hypothetical protein
MLRTLIAIAAFALLAGCAVKEDLNSSGTKEIDVKVGAEKAPEVDPDQAQVQNNDDVPAAPAIHSPLPEEKKDDAKVEKPDAGVTEASLAGTYDGKIDISKESLDGLMAMVPPDQKSAADAMVAEIKNVVITFVTKKDGSYDLTFKSKRGGETQSGKWRYDKTKGVMLLKAPEMTAAQIEQAKKMGATEQEIKEAREKEQTVTVSKDGRTLTLSNTEFGMPLSIIFTKK